MLAAVLCGRIFAAENKTALSRAKESITRTDLSTHISVLADDTFEGREAGARGGRAAGNYLAQQLEKLMLAPAGDAGGYFQSFGGARNILGMLEGSDPQLRDEVVVLGAHYDHVGYGSQRNSYGPWGYIHNGADDNASGTAALLEVAQALQELPEHPRRSILFAFWDGEEKGLLGSKHWVAAPTIDIKRVRVMNNIDMIGRLTKNRVELYGTRSGKGLRSMVAEANRESALDLDCTWTMKDDSDHWPFFAKGIPVLMFHTGLHADYHRPSDDVERVNFAGTEQVTRLVFQSIHALASADKLPEFRSESRRESERERRMLEQAVATSPPRLGMMWQVQNGVEGMITLRATTIHRASAAEIAGLRVGDVITMLDGQPIANEALFRQQILASQAPLRLRIERLGQIPRDFSVNLTGPPVRVGFSWREDPAEPGTVIVSNVVFGSPAHVANVQVGDRVIAVDGQGFTSTLELQNRLDVAQDTLAVTVEKRGIISEMTLKLLASSPPSP